MVVSEFMNQHHACSMWGGLGKRAPFRQTKFHCVPVAIVLLATHKTGLSYSIIQLAIKLSEEKL